MYQFFKYIFNSRFRYLWTQKNYFIKTNLFTQSLILNKTSKKGRKLQKYLCNAYIKQNYFLNFKIIIILEI